MGDQEKKKALTAVDGQVDVAVLCSQDVCGRAAIQARRLRGDVGDLDGAWQIPWGAETEEGDLDDVIASSSLKVCWPGLEVFEHLKATAGGGQKTAAGHLHYGSILHFVFAREKFLLL